MKSFSLTKLPKLDPKVGTLSGSMELFSSTKLEKDNKTNKLYGGQSVKRDFKHKFNGKRERKQEEVSLNIYAELSRKKHSQVLSGEMELCFPYGVELKSKYGDKSLFLQCVDENAKAILIEGLEASGISWQEN